MAVAMTCATRASNPSPTTRSMSPRLKLSSTTTTTTTMSIPMLKQLLMIGFAAAVSNGANNSHVFH